MDLFAAEAGLDPAEVRRRNVIPADAFPHTTAMGVTYDIGDYEQALDLVLDAAGYEDLRAEQARRRAADEVVQLGIGVSLYVERSEERRVGKSVSVRVDLGGRPILKKKKNTQKTPNKHSH